MKLGVPLRVIAAAVWRRLTTAALQGTAQMLVRAYAAGPTRGPILPVSEGLPSPSLPAASVLASGAVDRAASPRNLPQRPQPEKQRPSSSGLRLLVRLPTGSLLPLAAGADELVSEFVGRVLLACGLPQGSASFGLSLGLDALRDALSLASNAVRDGDTLDLVVHGATPAALEAEQAMLWERVTPPQR